MWFNSVSLEPSLVYKAVYHNGFFVNGLEQHSAITRAQTNPVDHNKRARQEASSHVTAEGEKTSRAIASFTPEQELAMENVDLVQLWTVTVGTMSSGMHSRKFCTGPKITARSTTM